MVRVSATIVTVALLSAPAIAVSRENYVRDNTEGEAFNREIHDALLVARKELESVYGRELVDSLEARDPFLGAIFGIAKVAAKVGSKVASKAASKGTRKIAKEAHRQNNNNNNNRKNRRDIGGSDYEYQFEREFDDLDVRGFLDDLD